jgi:hypothetical protein
MLRLMQKREWLSVEIDEMSAPASGTGCVGKVMGDGRICDKTVPRPSRDILPARVYRRVALGILHGRSVNELRLAAAHRRRPRISAGGGDKSHLAGPRGDRSRSSEHEARGFDGRL